MNGGDLREAAADEFWDKLNAAMGKDGLLTYRYLGRHSQEMHGLPVGTMKIRSDMRDWHGGIRPAALAIATAETGWSDFNAVPAPVSAGLDIIDPGVGVRQVTMRQRTLRLGRNLGFSRTIVADSDHPQRIIALTRGIGIKLGEAPPTGGQPFPLPDDLEDRDLPPLLRIFGGWRDGEGMLRLAALTAQNRSTSGSLHLGPIHVVFDAAADDLARETGQRIIGWEVMFVAAGTVGPFLVEVERLSAGGRLGAAEFSLIDEGRDSRLVASGSAAFGPLEGLPA
ncbi:hypothetical protein [Sphingobium sp.]|uniref:hypothetical protein n=1 Tax=Sphingobium sp. TaxID=1912891 RepID=UPI002CA07501|nr:hypothetical protein [Sphingobium sp.]HUD90646.1 hypothetical protein [Sphingobium sp.]